MKPVRPVRIHLAMKDSPLPRAIRQVLPIIGNEKTLQYVEKIDEADLIIFSNLQEIERDYKKEKAYGFLSTTSEKPETLPNNCKILDPMSLLIDLIQLIDDVARKL